MNSVDALKSVAVLDFMRMVTGPHRSGWTVGSGCWERGSKPGNRAFVVTAIGEGGEAE